MCREIAAEEGDCSPEVVSARVSVGEIAADECDCSPEGASARVSCFEENVMENVGDIECFYGFCGPRKEAVAECA